MFHQLLLNTCNWNRAGCKTTPMEFPSLLPPLLMAAAKTAVLLAEPPIKLQVSVVTIIS